DRGGLLPGRCDAHHRRHLGQRRGGGPQAGRDGVARASGARRRLSPSPDRRGQRRRPPEAHADAPSGDSPCDGWQARPRTLGAGLLRRVRRPAEEEGGGEGHRGVKYRIGIDVGGTFTDLVLAAGGRIRLDKHPTTPEDQSEGVLAGLARLARGEGLSTDTLLARTALVVHGTTTADNTMIEMSGATVGLVTSEGHRDEIEIRRGYKEDIWYPPLPPRPPLCPRLWRYGVPDRLDSQ